MKRLSEIERLLEKEKYELAMNNLSDINVKRLNEENKAYYDLLMTQANFWSRQANRFRLLD
mgnify:CR=1 FL=1